MSNRKFGILCSLPGIVTLTVLIIYPTVYNVYASILRYDNVSPVAFNGFENYRWLFSSITSDFYLSWKVSTLYSLGTTGLAFLLGLILAHALHRINRHKAVFRTLTMLPWASPLIISGFIWTWILNEDAGILNYLLLSFRLVSDKVPFLSDPNLAMIAGILASAWCYTPFITILLVAGLESIPVSLYEAATVDGADQVQRFWYISLSLNRHQMLIACLIVLMFTFRTPDIFFSLTKGGPGKHTYHAGLFLVDTIYRHLNFGRAGAISVVLLMTVAGFSFPLLYYGIIRRARS